MTTSRLPDAIGIGCRRCATSWLHEILNQHPQIRKPPSGVDFFSENRARGVDWYREHFRDCDCHKVVLELSVSYTYPEHYLEAARAVHDLIPGAKLFVALRNPVDRAFSDYLRSIRRLEIPKDIPFEQAIRVYPVLLQRGMYGKLLEPFWDRFPENRRLALIYDDLISDPDSYLKNLWDFLGVETLLDLDTRRKESRGRSISSTHFNRFVLAAKESAEATLLHIRLGNVWTFIQRRFLPVYQRLLALNEKPATLDPPTRSQLLDHYAPDIRKLEKLIQRDLGFWI